jgi:hypothetical protein
VVGLSKYNNAAHTGATGGTQIVEFVRGATRARSRVGGQAHDERSPYMLFGGGDLLEDGAADARLGREQSSCLVLRRPSAAWSPASFDEAGSDRIARACHHDRPGSRRRLRVEFAQNDKLCNRLSRRRRKIQPCELIALSIAPGRPMLRASPNDHSSAKNA